MSRATADRAETLTRRARAAEGDVEAAIAVGLDLATAPLPGDSATPLHLLAAVAEGSAMVARVAEPQLDASIILAECPEPVVLDRVGADRTSTWGVYAAEAPGAVLAATETAEGGWRLDGTKPWCSLAGRLSHALVTAHTPDGRRLFAVDLRQGVTPHPEAWVARGLPGVDSAPADFEGVAAVPVGAAGWYLERPGFEWGGIRVAACWHGAAVDIGRAVQRHAAARDSEILWMHAGRVEAALHGSRLALAEAGRRIDGLGMPDPGLDEGDEQAHPDAPAHLAQLTRTVVRTAAETVLREAAHALGPAPASLDPHLAAQLSDLALYLQQDHAERDEARLGRLGGSARR